MLLRREAFVIFSWSIRRCSGDNRGYTRSPRRTRNMNEDQNVDLETQNQDGSQAPQQPVGDAAPVVIELSPFEQQLKDIEERNKALEIELESRKKQLELKDKALKKKEDSLDPDLEKRLMDRIEEQLQARERESKIKNLTPDEAAQKLVKHHLENTIRPSGNVENDIQAAWAIVNQRAMQELLKNKASYEAYEELVSSSQVGGNVASNSQQKSVSPARRQAEEILRAINPEALKHLKI